MMSSSSEQSEWTVVHGVGKARSRGRGGKHVPPTAPVISRKANDDDNDNDIQRVDAKEIERLFHTLESHQRAFQHDADARCSISSVVQESLQTYLCRKEKLHFTNIIALGIGSVVDSINAQWQFAFLLFLRSLCQRPSCSSSQLESLLSTSSTDTHAVAVTCYDPTMTLTDIAVCQRFGIDVLTENSKGLFHSALTTKSVASAAIHADASSDSSTLIYMPHCPYRLYCNVLWSFWESLPSIFIIGNSFQSYALRRGFASSFHSGSDSSSSGKKKKKRQNQQQQEKDKATSSPDETDSVALVTPILFEVSLPTTLRAAHDGHFAQHSHESSTTQASATSSIPSHILESAFCELRYVKYEDSSVLFHVVVNVVVDYVHIN